jgi:hypothetical protein
MLDLIANATPPGFTAEQVGALIVAVIVALGGGGIIGRVIGKKEATGTRLEEPVPTVPVRKVPGGVHYYQHEALDRRVGELEKDVKEIKDNQADQYVQILEAGQERELRLMEKMDGQTRELHARLDDQFGPRPVRRKGGQ